MGALDPANDWNRRISPIAVRPAEGLLSDRIAAAWRRQRERVFVPRAPIDRDWLRKLDRVALELAAEIENLSAAPR
jgi:hypothetical protein